MPRVIRPRLGLEVYTSKSGNVVIKQNGAMGEEDIVTIPPEDVPQLIKMLQDEAKEIRSLLPEPSTTKKRNAAR